MRWPIRATVGTVLVLMAATSSAQVTNGGFETGNFSGWTQFGNTGADGVTSDGSYVAEGSYGARFGCWLVAGSGVQQAVPTMLGTYNLSFSYRWSELYAAGSGGYFRVYWDGAQIYEDATPYTSTTGWFHKTFAVTGSGSPTTLRFHMYNDWDYYALDNIRLDPAPAAVPEPALIQLPVLLGLSGIGLWRRRRRTA